MQDTDVFVGQMAALFDSLTWDEIADDTSGVIQVRPRRSDLLV